jgi:hypothetical protein
MHDGMKQDQPDRCASCYGEGVISGIAGPQPCPDCGGVGALPSSNTLAERRLRDLETEYARRGGQIESDMRWLVDEVRRGRHALIQILAAAQDADSEDALASRVRFLANAAIGLYPVDSD